MAGKEKRSSVRRERYGGKSQYGEKDMAGKVQYDEKDMAGNIWRERYSGKRTHACMHLQPPTIQHTTYGTAAGL